MQNISKIKSYVGFAIKAQKVVYGIDNIMIMKYPPRYVLYDFGLADNSKKKLVAFLENKGIEHCEINLAEIVFKENCKAIGILEKNLIIAIKSALKEN